MERFISGITYYKNGIEEEVRKLKNIGYEGAEIDLSLSMADNPKFEEYLKRPASILPFASSHLPDGVDYTRKEAEKFKELIEKLSRYGCKTFVMHLFSPHRSTHEYFEEKVGMLKELTKYVHSKDAVLTLENTVEGVEEMKKVFDRVDGLKFCLDIGHANLFSPEDRSLSFIDAFGDRLFHVHAHDNLGGDTEKDDLHLPFGEGNIDLSRIFEKLKNIQYSGNITLEIFNGNNEQIRDSIEKVRERGMEQ